MQIIIAAHERVIVGVVEQDRAVIVLRPPGADPQTILRVARVALPHAAYQALAARLAVAPAISVD